MTAFNEALKMNSENAARQYHRNPRPGKIEVIPTKPCLTQADLSLAYSPGVAVPCRDIHKTPGLSYDYTARGNLIAVITNGTAVLGLGNIGPLAGKPVMEGKAVLFKRFANIDVFDIEVNTTDPDEFIRTVRLLEPSFGGINLEDIRAPDCFYIEEQLKKKMTIPVFHDDQHGTAIISAAAMLNAVELTGRRISDLKVVINGAGAAGIACAKLYIRLGVQKDNLRLVDSRGVVYRGRQAGMNPYKEEFALDTTERSLDDAVNGADLLVGLSVKGAFSASLIARMNHQPIIFALANPDPEIDYDRAKATRPDAIIATGRSDYPNQVNNVLGFPYIFRAALDVRATSINDEMKIAAVRALAELAKEDVPDSVVRSYGGQPIIFGPDYIIPKPLDTRVLLKVVPAIATAALESGAASGQTLDPLEYAHRLEVTLGPERETMRNIITSAQQKPKRIVLPEGEHPVIVRAAYQVLREGIAHPLLLGNDRRIQQLAERLQIPLKGMEILDPRSNGYFDQFSERLHDLRSRKGWTMSETRRQLTNPYVFGAMMVREGIVDGQVHGIDQSYPNAIRPVLQVIPRRPGVSRVSGLYLVIIQNRSFLLADTTVNIEPDSETLAEIAILSAEMAEFFNMQPRVAMLSYSNFGSVGDKNARKMAHAVDIVRRCRPDLLIDGEMQADTAVSIEILTNQFSFNRLRGNPANVLIFPNLSSGNMAYKLLQQLGGATAIGPLLMGISKPFNVLQRNTDIENVVNVIAITVAQMHRLEQASAPYCDLEKSMPTNTMSADSSISATQTTL